MTPAAVAALRPVFSPRAHSAPARVIETTLALLRAAADRDAGGNASTVAAPQARRGEGPGVPEVPAHAPPDPDRELVLRVFAEYPHGTRAFGELMEHFWGRMWAICQSVLLNEHDAEDAVQDAFLKAHRYLASYRFESRFASWLSRIARREALTRYGRRKRERDAVDRILADPGTFAVWRPWSSRNPSDTTIGLRDALDGLDPEDRMLLVLHELQGYSYEEIAADLDLSAGAVRMRAMRARRKLRDVLEPRPVPEGA